MESQTVNLFFLWVYFRIDGSEYRADIVDVAIQKAIDDATNQGAFNTRGLTSEAKKAIKERARSAAFVAIDSSGNYGSFSEWHEKACRDLVCDSFTIGNAQKVINMSIKYLYMIASASSQIYKGITDYLKWYEDRLRRFESEFHIPIDNYVLQYIYDDKLVNHTEFGCDEGIEIRKASNNNYRICDCNSEYPWSKIPDYNAYMRIQNAVRSCYGPIYPIKWENGVWVEAAKKRKD